MKKMISAVIAAVLFGMALSGCGDNESSSSATGDTAATTAQSSTQSSENPNEAAVGSLDIVGFSTDSFNMETDNQNFFGDSHDIVVTDNGYYFFFGEYLYFYDNGSDSVVPLCSDPDCTHSSEEDCNAYFPAEQYYTDLGIFYYDSSLYVLGNNGEENSGKLYLYKVSKDGSVRDQACCLGEFGSDIYEMKLRLMIHKGVGYVSYTDDTECKLCSFNIGESEPQMNTIDEFSGTGAEIYRLYGCDDGISYQYGCFTDEDLENFEGGIRVYLGDEPLTIVDGAIKTYVIANGSVYYETDSAVKVKSLKSGETTDFSTDSSAHSVSWDGKYFYVYDVMAEGSQEICVYDSEQNLVGKFSCPDDTTELMFGDQNKFFCSRKDESSSKIECLDKSKIEDDSAEWEILLSVSVTN